MGVKLKDLAVRKEISFADLKNKVIAIDAYNVLYQFLSSIRQMDGSYLTDSKGRVTSHLIGLFSRMTKLLIHGIKPVMVFDGKPSDLKQGVLDQRKEIKKRAQEKYDAALRDGDYKEAYKYSRQISKLTPEMADEARKLLTALGIPYVDAPSEGEAQASYMCKHGIAYATGSQDYDTLLFGTTYLIQNLTMSSKRKSKDKLSYMKIVPEIISLKDTLDSMEITHNQLIIIGVLTGTDFAPQGIPGIGPKKALKLVKDYGEDIEKIKEVTKWDEHNPDVTFEQVFEMFKKPDVVDVDEPEFKSPSKEQLLVLLCEEHDFSKDRVIQTYEKIMEKQKENNQKSLFDF